ncbi:MAG TPA: 2-phospho-L-lactate guanylyltransferase [bacterium]|nr:2-phospho-L-lactate guanylyltransferase [bacterium]
MTTVCATIPQSRLHDAKTRLAPALGPRRRTALALALLGHVCAVVRATPGVERLTIVSPDPRVRSWGGAHGYAVVLDPGRGLNTALGGILRSGARAGRGVLVIAADLPWLGVHDVAALLEALRPGRVVLAPSKDGAGTNALVLPAGCQFTPAFGPGSRTAHHREAASRRLEVVEVVRPGVAFDIDTPDDLAALEAAGWSDGVVWGPGRLGRDSP